MRTCPQCGEELRPHEDACDTHAGKMGWTIEYEIPPLRAIYRAEADNCTEDEVREMVKREQPLWKIRKITKR